MIFIEANRNGYTPEQCGNTLTVQELIEILSDYNGDDFIYLSHDNGYSYGNITTDSIIET